MRYWPVVNDSVVLVGAGCPISLVIKHLGSVLSSRLGGLTTGWSAYSLDSAVNSVSLVTLFMSSIKLDGLGLKSSIRLW